MNEETFIIHIMVLGGLTIIAGIASIGFMIAYYNDTVEFAGITLKQKKWFGLSFLSFCLFVGGLVWWVASAGQPWRTIVISTHEIKDVVWPDDTKTQMFSCDGTDYNITKLFEKIVDKDKWVVKRIRWSPFYLGVSWSNSGRCEKDRFYLEHKEIPNKSFEL